MSRSDLIRLGFSASILLMGLATTMPATAQPAAACVADFALYGEDKLDIKKDVSVNGNEVDQAPGASGGNALTPDGDVVDATRDLPMFDPPSFPNINTNDEFDTGDDGSIINAGEYKKVKIDNDDTLTFDTSDGQDFLIEKIEAKSKSVLNFQPGRYFIDKFQADDDVVLNVLNGGPVEIFIGDKLEPKKGAEFNTGGSPGDLIIRLYQDAEAKFKEESEFTSTIYAPGDNSKIEFKKESVVNGGVFTRGEVKIDKDTELFYGADAEQAGREVAQCDVTPELILEYRMEEPSWDGTAGEVEDTSGNGRNGTSKGGADTNNANPAIDSNPGTCRYGEFDGNNDGIDDADASNYLEGLSGITVMAWVYNTDSLNGNDRGIFFTDNPSGKDNRLGLRYDTSGFAGGKNNVIKASVFTDDCNANSECLQVETEANTMVRDQWQHVAMTWRSGGTIKIFVDGAEVGISAVDGPGANGVIDRIDALNIGQSTKNERWQGRIDEFRIFDGALSEGEIRDWKDTTAPCEVLLPDHIRLLHPGSGLTCAPSQITVQACADFDCTALFDEAVTVTFTSPLGNWSANPVDFTGETTVGLQVTTPGMVRLDAGSDPPANGGTRCFTGGGETCDMEWFDSGFVIDVPDHVADTVQEGTVAAVRSDDETQTCTPGFSNETRTVGFSSGYVNPGTGTRPVAINGTTVSGSSPGTGITLNFDGTGVAPIDVRYADVGDVQLNARFDGSGDEAGLVMIGNERFITRPDTFTLDIPDNPGATDAGGPVFTVSGADFEVNVQALNASGGITPNFGRESPPEDVALETTLVAPPGGNVPGLIGSFGDFGEDCEGNSSTPGTACGAFAWPEVGIIAITPRLASGAYLGTADVVGDETGPVGRFIPSHFNLSAGALTDRVELTDCTDNFTYIGELFGADWTLAARNAGDGTTENYEGAFARLGAGSLDIAADEDITVDSSSIIWAGGFGTASAEISANRSAPAGPFEDFQVGTAPVDADGVELNTFDIDLSGDGSDDHGLVGTTELRFGRLVVDNAVGSELGPLVLPLRAEFFENETWKNNALDDCTAISLVDEAELTSSTGDTGEGTATVGVGSGSTSIQEADPVTLTNGSAGFTFSAPGSDGTGWVELLLELDMDWHFLRDDLDDDGNYLENPNARASFGLFEGDENRILLQEIAPR